MFASERHKHKSSIFADRYDDLSRQRADILVTHEAPGFHPHGFDALTLLAVGMGVKQSFHGHQHDRLDYSAQAGARGFAAFGVGLRGITDRHGVCVKFGELDDRRMQRQYLEITK